MKPSTRSDLYAIWLLICFYILPPLTLALAIAWWLK